ncbi:hypothetical protein Emag_007415 [Eimeria magna]
MKSYRETGAIRGRRGGTEDNKDETGRPQGHPDLRLDPRLNKPRPQDGLNACNQQQHTHPGTAAAAAFAAAAFAAAAFAAAASAASAAAVAMSFWCHLRGGHRMAWISRRGAPRPVGLTTGVP